MWFSVKYIQHSFSTQALTKSAADDECLQYKSLKCHQLLSTSLCDTGGES